MPVIVVLVLMLSVAFRAPVGAQEVTVNGIELQDAQTNLNITVDVLEVREGSDPAVRLTAGKKRYGSRSCPRPRSGCSMSSSRRRTPPPTTLT